MKNVRRVSRGPLLRVPIQGVHLSGWAVQYVSGIDDSKIEPGFWLSIWEESSKDIGFHFEAGLHMCFNDEQGAKRASDILRQEMQIETTVVKIP